MAVDGSTVVFYARGSREKQLIITALRRAIKAGSESKSRKAVDKEEVEDIAVSLSELGAEERFVWLQERYLNHLCNTSYDFKG